MSLRRVATAVGTFALISVTIVPTLKAASPFSDVPPSYWGATAIDAMAAQGIVNGVGGGLFLPNARITREELATIFVRAKGLSPTLTGPPFSDVSPANFYAPYIETATGDGFMQPATATTFGGTADITRADTAVAIIDFLGLERVAAAMSGTHLTYSDTAQIPSADVGAVALAQRLGLMVGDNNAFSPTEILTRAQVSEVVWRALGLTQSQIAGAVAPAASSLYLSPQSVSLNVGQSFTLHPYVHDAAKDLIPASVTFSASHGTIAGTTYTATSQGQDTVRGTVPGTSVSSTMAVTVYQPQSLYVSIPSVDAVQVAVPLEVQVRASAGGLDAADGGRVIAVAYSGPQSGTLSLTDSGGVADGSVTFPQAGTYTLTATASGLTTGTSTVTVLAAAGGAYTLTLPSTAYAGTSLPITVNNPDPSPLPLHISVTGPATVSGVKGSAPAGTSTVGTLTLTGQGPVTVTASAPGGAAGSAQAQITAQAIGTLSPSSPSLTVQAGTQTTVSYTVSGAMAPPAGLPVSVVPVEPNGSQMTSESGTISSSGTFSFTFRPERSGSYTFQVSAPDFTLGPAPAFTVTPAPAVGLAATLTPSTVVRDGQSATVVAALVDQYGNPVSQGFRVAVTAQGTQEGTITPDASYLPGPGTAATFTATAASGTSTITVSSPGSSYAPVTITVRDVADSNTGVLSGYGVWIPYWEWVNMPDATILSDLTQAGATNVYLEVATTDSNGFYGGPGLDDLLYKLHNAGIAVFAWVYPNLNTPGSDLAFTQTVLDYASPLGARPDGLAMDIEENMAPSVVGSYVAAVRQMAGGAVPLIGVTYPPQQRPSYPFAAMAPYVDAFAPMDYWHGLENDVSYNQVLAFVNTSISETRQLSGEPSAVVVPILQTFDLYYTKGPYNPTFMELEGGLVASQLAANVPGASFYEINDVTPAEWQAIETFPWGGRLPGQ